MTRITSLTPDQWERVHAAREEWREVGLCTEPADRPAAEAAVTELYRRLGQPEPRYIWLDGPCSAVYLGPLLIAARQLAAQLGAQLGDQLREKLRDQLDAQLRAQLGDQLREKLHEQLRAQLRAQLRDQLAAQLCEQLREQLDAQLSDQLREQLAAQLRALDAQIDAQIDALHDQLDSPLRTQLREQLRDQLDAQLHDQLATQLDAQLRTQLRAQLGDQLRAQLYAELGAQLHDQLGDQLRAQLRDLDAQLGDQGQSQRAAVWRVREWGAEYCWWVAWYTAARDIAGVTYTEEQSSLLDTWAALMRSSGWWFPFSDVCIMTERHRALHFDADRRLHCESGPAIECRDGFRVYAWHGVRVPAEWIEDRAALDPATALTWANVEQRHAAAQIIGWARILETLPVRVIDSDPDPLFGDLLEVDLPDAPNSRFLRARCGTGRTIVIGVSPDARTAVEAGAMSYDVPVDVYQLLEDRA
jgi:hypothetical protein